MLLETSVASICKLKQGQSQQYNAVSVMKNNLGWTLLL